MPRSPRSQPSRARQRHSQEAEKEKTRFDFAVVLQRRSRKRVFIKLMLMPRTNVVRMPVGMRVVERMAVPQTISGRSNWRPKALAIPAGIADIDKSLHSVFVFDRHFGTYGQRLEYSNLPAR